MLVYVHRNHGPIYTQVHDRNRRLIRELYESRSGRPGRAPVPNKPAVCVMDLCVCVYISVVSVDVKQHSANQHSGSVSVIG